MRTPKLSPNSGWHAGAASLALSALFLLGSKECAQTPEEVPFVPNVFFTTTETSYVNNCTEDSCGGPFPVFTPIAPAYADILQKPANFLPCEGGPYALCYYSGDGSLPCRIDDEHHIARCDCYEIPYGPFYIDINAILNTEIYAETVAACGHDGSNCGATNSAPVCKYANGQGSASDFIRGADLLSTFSLACVPENGISQTECAGPQSGFYAGCMTAPCYQKPGNRKKGKEIGRKGRHHRHAAEEDPTGVQVVECACPVWDGPYEIGEPGGKCDLFESSGGENLWSAAHSTADTKRTPPGMESCGDPGWDGSCKPDAPQDTNLACPLYDTSNDCGTAGTLSDAQKAQFCGDVCSFYSTCQSAYTCDATLCTTNSCTGANLVDTACAELPGCTSTAGVSSFAAVYAVEKLAGCSCCASQLCGCDSATPDTNGEIGNLVVEQRAQNFVPQCDRNGTLCGTATPVAP